MNVRMAMSTLRRAGTAHNRGLYARHGVGASQFGVGFVHLHALAGMIGTDQKLAQQLWDTRNHDARILATMIADPRAVTSRLLDRWSRQLQNYIQADAFSKLVYATPFARSKADRWTTSRSEWISQTGWNLVCHLAMGDARLRNEYFLERLAAIATRIHTRKNRVRHAMNMAVVAIGTRNARLRRAALRVAGTIGTVYVDHGDTACITPDAATAILRTWRRRKRPL